MTNNLLYVALQSPDTALCDRLRQAGWDVDTVESLAGAKRKLRAGKHAAGLLVAERVDEHARSDVESLLQHASGIVWVGAFAESFVRTPHNHDFILNYFFDFHTLPIDDARLLHTIGHARGVYQLRHHQDARERSALSDLIVGDSPAIRKHLREIRKIAAVDAPVMISGPSGSGKELAAQAIHRLSKRAQGPFIAVNCSALPASLIQSELFGHEKGAFSGATRSKQGFIEAAAGGTIFLDEIGDIPLELQTNLLRFLQEKTINRIGSTQLLHVDARVVAASHMDLENAVSAGRFREDLYYRLNVLPLQVPSLQQRKEDIQSLAEHFYALFERERNPRVKGFSSSAIKSMQAYDWPGNVRELLNRVRRALIMAEGRLITSRDLGLERNAAVAEQLVLTDARLLAERLAIQTSLSNAGNNMTHAARELGVSRMTLYRLLEKHQLQS